MTVHGVSGGRGAALAALLLASGLVLTGCSGPSDPFLDTPSPRATTTPTEMISPPTPPASTRPSARAVVTDIYISATSIELREESGETLATFDYFQPADEVVAGLTAALGSAPITEDYESEHVEQHPGTRYSWGNTYVKDPGFGLNP